VHRRRRRNPDVTPPDVTPPNRRERERLRIRMLPSGTLETLFCAGRLMLMLLLFLLLMLLLLLLFFVVVGLFFEQRLNFPSTFVDA